MTLQLYRCGFCGKETTDYQTHTMHRCSNTDLSGLNQYIALKNQHNYFGLDRSVEPHRFSKRYKSTPLKWYQNKLFQWIAHKILEGII